MNISFFGSSLVSAYWNGAATYYRGLLRALARRGHRVTFCEPNAFDRQANRDIPDPDWARVVVYPATDDGWRETLEAAARDADLLVKASGVGVFDAELEAAVAGLGRPGLTTAFWDVDAPATLARIAADPKDPMRGNIPDFDLVFTYGGGAPVIRAYEALGARLCQPIYNALDPAAHYPVPPEPRFACNLSFLGNRLPDREDRVTEFFFEAARRLPAENFLLGGSGWQPETVPDNVTALGHVGTRDHNALFASSLATLNITRESMAANGFSPATRVFEAAGAGACLITDAWEGIEQFLEPGREVLVARSGAEVGEILGSLTPERASAIGARALERVLLDHTYAQRALEVERVLDAAPRRAEVPA